MSPTIEPWSDRVLLSRELAEEIARTLRQVIELSAAQPYSQKLLRIAKPAADVLERFEACFPKSQSVK